MLVNKRMVSSGILGNASVFDPEISMFPFGSTIGHLGESRPLISVSTLNPFAISSDCSFSIRTGSLITLGPSSEFYTNNQSVSRIKIKNALMF